MCRAIRRAGLVAVLLGLACCAHQGAMSPQAGAGSRAPADDVSGLEVSGPRTRANVLANMAPVVRRMQAIYEEHQARNPGLEGRLVLRFTVEWNGEIGRVEILPTSTVTDPELREKALRPIEYTDFDVWGPRDQETVVVYPVVFGDQKGSRDEE